MKKVLLFTVAAFIISSSLFAQKRVEHKYVVKYLSHPPILVNNNSYYINDTLCISDKIVFNNNKSIILFHINSKKRFPIKRNKYKKGESLSDFLSRNNLGPDGSSMGGRRGSK